MTSKTSFFIRVGSNWSAYLPLWIISLLVWSLISTLLLGIALDVGRFIPALVANLCSIVVVLALWLVWSSLFRLLQKNGLVSAWCVVAMGVVVGLGKGLTTNLVLNLLTETEFSYAELLQSTLPAAVTGAWLLPAFGIIGSLRAEYDRERNQLINEIVAQELTSATSKYVEQDLAHFVTRAREQLEKASTSEYDFTATLNELAELDVRPMSHELWQKESSQISSFGFRDIVVSALTQHKFPAGWTSLTLFVSLLSLQIPLVGFTDALARSVVQSIITYAFLLAGRVLPFRGKLSGPLVFLLTPAAIVICIEVTTLLVFGPLPGISGWVVESILYLCFVTSLLILGAVFVARGTHEDIKRQIVELRSVSTTQDAASIVSLIKRRETAELLHGFVQNQLLTSAVALSTSRKSFFEVQQHISGMLDDLAAGRPGPSEGSFSTLDELARYMANLWRGIMDITVSHPPTASLSQAEFSLVDKLVSEFAANSRRHGNATSLHIDLSCTADILTLRAQDDGIGLEVGRDGLGTALLNSLSVGNWSRTSFPGQPGTTVICHIPRVKDFAP